MILAYPISCSYVLSVVALQLLAAAICAVMLVTVIVSGPYYPFLRRSWALDLERTSVASRALYRLLGSQFQVLEKVLGFFSRLVLALPAGERFHCAATCFPYLQVLHVCSYRRRAAGRQACLGFQLCHSSHAIVRRPPNDLCYLLVGPLLWVQCGDLEGHGVLDWLLLLIPFSSSGTLRPWLLYSFRFL